MFDQVFWFGDLNFRINGTRECVDGMLENHMFDALLCNDQLTLLMRFNRVFSGFAEGPLNFFPTYKFDHIQVRIEVLLFASYVCATQTSVDLFFFYFSCVDHYDSSQRRRVPSWTDRILYKKDASTEVLSYCSAPDVKLSDHRPVYATFRSHIDIQNTNSDDDDAAWKKRIIEREIKSEVCCIS